MHRKEQWGILTLQLNFAHALRTHLHDTIAFRGFLQKNLYLIGSEPLPAFAKRTTAQTPLMVSCPFGIH